MCPHQERGDLPKAEALTELQRAIDYQLVALLRRPFVKVKRMLSEGTPTSTTSKESHKESLLTPGRAIAAFGSTIVLIVGVLISMPDASVVSTSSCGSSNVVSHLVCRADAHSGVIACLTLVIALIAGLLAYLTLRGERDAQARAQELQTQMEALSTAREVELEKQERRRYEALLHETLYEAVHNLRHLADVVSWTPSGAEVNEYEGCNPVSGRPFLDFRYAERLLEVPYVGRLEGDAPAVVGLLDHARRNARFIDHQDDSDAGLAAMAKPAVWMTEQLLRVLAGVRHRSVRPSAIAERILIAAELEGKMNPDADGAPIGDPLPVEIELRDRVRFVKLKEGIDGRQLDTTVACFAPDGAELELFKALKGMEDPPPRPKRPPSDTP